MLEEQHLHDLFPNVVISVTKPYNTSEIKCYNFVADQEFCTKNRKKHF